VTKGANVKLKRGDEVIITVGKDKGRKGKIEKIFPKDGTVVISGINIVKKHVKKRDEKNPGGIIEVSKPINISKIAILCFKCGKTSRVGFKLEGEEKIRICRKCEARI